MRGTVREGVMERSWRDRSIARKTKIERKKTHRQTGSGIKTHRDSQRMTDREGRRDKEREIEIEKD